MPDMARRVGRDEDRFDAVVFDEFFERRIGLRAATRFGQLGAAIWNQIADRHDFDIRMILKTKRGAEFANTIPNDADANFAIGDRLPTS